MSELKISLNRTTNYIGLGLNFKNMEAIIKDERSFKWIFYTQVFSILFLCFEFALYRKNKEVGK